MDKEAKYLPSVEPPTFSSKNIHLIVVFLSVDKPDKMSRPLETDVSETLTNLLTHRTVQ